MISDATADILGNRAGQDGFRSIWREGQECGMRWRNVLSAASVCQLVRGSVLVGLTTGVLWPLLPPACAQDPPGPDPNRWQEAISEFAKLDREQAPPRGANLFVGSSSIRMWDLPEDFPAIATINRGFGGSQLSDALHFLDRLVFRHRPSVVVVYAGDNDVAFGKSASVVTADFRELARRIHEHLPRTRIVYISIKPSLDRWALADTMQRANQAIAEYCDGDQRLRFVDIWQPMLDDRGQPREKWFVEDGLHLNREGYQLWADLLRPHLNVDESIPDPSSRDAP